MTCNPRWKEIQEALLPGQEPVDRPDIVSRVFKLKLEELKKDLFVKNIFGEVAAWIYVIEFQKRGTSRAAIHIYTDKNGVEHMTENEVNSYLDTRYVCAPESIWHIFDFRMSDRSTPVMQLKVHLKNAQGVVYKEGEEKDAAQRGQLRDTTLTAWFAANQRCYDELESTGMIPEDVVDLPRYLLCRDARAFPNSPKENGSEKKCYKIDWKNAFRFSKRSGKICIESHASKRH
ncbi:hypothetical protein B9Z55_029018 [Caenorhabditis nigoni]|uniref:Helitron helicase-like domain-containing protein n=1 Tax=Caenorhabditis nigoni TaxID=1611254 RepID=A0A2G5S933_9PELO|nr:hypothetical protein B9Z55_029018 [Caenorhabditis nigoni]